MSTETPAHARYAADGTRIPDQCRFCGSENMDGSRSWRNVDRYSHDGNHVTVLSCDDCGGAYIYYETGNKRRNTPDNHTHTETRWAIPESYCLLVCPECGMIIESRDLDDPEDRAWVENFEAADERPHTACCDVEGVPVTGTYRRTGDGTPVLD